MVYKESIKVWREGNTDKLLNKFIYKFVYSSLKMEGANIIFKDVEAVFAGEKTANNCNSYIDFCRSILKLNGINKDIEINEDNALQIISNYYCNSYFVLGGPIARMLFNYILISNNLPPIIIFYHDKQEHDLSIEHFREGKDISKMIEFLGNQAYKTWIKDYNVKIKSLKDYLC